MGVLTCRNAENKYEPIGEAKGVVDIPAKNWIKLMVSAEGATDLTPLTALKADDLEELGLDSMPVMDAQLTNLRSLRELRTLGLFSNQNRQLRLNENSCPCASPSSKPAGDRSE
jgi:hypothetical protein